MNRSGMIKRGLAATAISALAVAGIPALAGTANAAVGSVSVAGVNGWTVFDIDEFVSTGDIIATVLEENGTTPSPNGTQLQASYVYTPFGGVAQDATPFAAAGAVAGGAGKANVTFVPPAAGTYALTVRTTATQKTAAVYNFTVGESEITWADGASASSPVNGNDTYTATLALTNPAKTPLVGRHIDINYTNGPGNAVFPEQTLPSERVNDANADSTSGTDGKFTVSLTDPALPATPESGTLFAEAPSLNVGDVNPAADAQASLDVEFEPTPTVTHIAVTRANVFGGAAAPGKGVELNVVVRGQAVADATPENDPILKDYPVNFAVNNGFLTPDTEGAGGTGLNVDPTDLVLKAGESDLGDLFGFYEDLGNAESVDTTDNAATNAAGVVATIGKDAGFNDDGLVTQTVTITAGAKSATETINYDVRNYLNIVGAAFRKDGGTTNVPGSVDLKFYAADQYGNLVGDQAASISDDSSIARVTPENNPATDFTTSNPTAVASSNAPTTQKVTGTVQAKKNLVAAGGNPGPETTAPVSGDITLVWKKAGPGGKTSIVAKLTGKNNGGKADKLTVVTSKKANGATVKLFKVVNGKLKPAGMKTLKNGRASFSKADKNGNAFTKYVAKVQSTNDTKGARTNKRNLR